MVKYIVTIQTNSQNNQVIKKGPKELKIRVSTPVQKSRANTSLISLLSEYFGVPKSRLIIVNDMGSKRIVVGIDHD